MKSNRASSLLRVLRANAAPAVVAGLLLYSPTTLLAAAPAVTFTPSQAEVACFEYLEVKVDVQEPVPGNPFVDTEVTGEFGHSGTPRLPVDGFCDSVDGKVFRIRFMPSVPGQYDYSITLRQKDIATRHEGQFTARPARLAGPVRIDPEHPFHFVREGTNRHWFWNGTTTYQLLAWDDETIAQSVTRLARLGVNRIRVALAGRTPDGARWNEPLVKPTDRFKFKMEPWVAARPENFQDPGYDVSRFNLSLFQKAEALLRLAREHDVIVSIIFYVDGRDKGVDPFGAQRMGGPEEQRYYRYAIARLAPFANVMWDLANEYRLFRDDPWAERMGAFVKQCDPYDQLTSTHGHGDFRFRKSTWADFAMFQSWDEAGGYAYMLKNRQEQIAAGRPMPQINEEYGYEDHYPTGWGGAKTWPSRNADSRRRLAWKIHMAGGYQTTGERADQGTGAGPDTGGGWINGRGDEHMTMLTGYRYMMDFFQSIPWWTLEPQPGLAHGPTLLLAQPGIRYVAYLPGPGQAEFTLETGIYRARWFNPRLNSWVPLPTVRQSGLGHWKSPQSPDAGDWALLLEREN